MCCIFCFIKINSKLIISGNGNLELSDNPVYETKKIKASTRIGEKPQTVTNLKLQLYNSCYIYF